jgi:hypothetical protein
VIHLELSDRIARLLAEATVRSTRNGESQVDERLLNPSNSISCFRGHHPMLTVQARLEYWVAGEPR